MKKLYKYRFIGFFNEPGAGHLKYILELDQGKRINYESMIRKLAKINKDKPKSLHIKELPPQRIMVAINKLITMYREGKIIGELPEIIKTRLGIDRRKQRKDKGTKREHYARGVREKVVDKPKVRGTSTWGKSAKPTMYAIPDVFEVLPVMHRMPDIFEVK